MTLPPPPVPPTAAAAPAAPAPLAFRKAEIGMSLDAWRASAPYRAAAACSPMGAALVCRAADQPLGGGYRASDLTSTFVDGRLASVTFATSIDAFADVVAELKRSDGQPDRVDRDATALASGVKLPHVRMVWRRGAAAIRLSDPVVLGPQLGLRVALDRADAPAPRVAAHG
jgi:hypothetical protein